MRIQELLRRKGFHVITVRPGVSVREAVALLREYNLGSVVVSADGRQVTGILTERDVVRRLVDGTDFLDGPVSAITERRIRHLPVVDDRGALAGIVSIGDAVKSHITQLEFERDQLQGYVSG